MLTTYTYNQFRQEGLKRFYQIGKADLSYDDCYPNKLLNLNRYIFRLFYLYESPRFRTMSDGKVTGADAFMVECALEHLNASVNVTAVGDAGRYLKALNGQHFDMSIDTQTRIFESGDVACEAVNTFDTDGFCALIPLPPRKSFLDLLLKPFDSWTWFFVGFTMISAALVWHGLNKTFRTNSVSAGYFVFSFVAHFVGQSIPFQEHHVKQKILLQLTIFLTFILGNAYQSLIISYISDAKFGEKLTTINDLIDSNLTFAADPFFVKMLIKTDGLNGLKTKFSEKLTTLSHLNYSRLASEQKAIILSCNNAELILYHMNSDHPYDETAINFYYQLPERFYTFYLFFMMNQYSPFGERMQELMSNMFESGLQQHWIAQPPKEDSQARKQREYNENEEYLMNLKDLSGLYYILVMGWIVSFFVMLLEIFARDFIQKLNIGRISRALRTLMRRMVRERRQFRVVEVQPLRV